MSQDYGKDTEMDTPDTPDEMELAEERRFARFLRRAFEIEAENTISDEQIERILEPIRARIDAGEFSQPQNEAQTAADVTWVLTPAITITALHNAVRAKKTQKEKQRKATENTKGR